MSDPTNARSLSLDRFLSALGEVHPMNLATVVENARTDAGVAMSSASLRQAVESDEANRDTVGEIRARVRTVLNTAIGKGFEMPGDADDQLLAAAYAVRWSTLPGAADVYRPFEGIVPARTLSALGDDERALLDQRSAAES